MGIDAVILVKAGELTDERLSELRREYERCINGIDDDIWLPRRANDYEMDRNPGVTLSVWMVHRYFDSEYARGRWPTIYTALRWCVDRWGYENVLYGGDCSDTHPVLTPEFCEACWREWSLYGNLRY
jgi:hypothetical protein